VRVPPAHEFSAALYFLISEGPIWQKWYRKATDGRWYVFLSLTGFLYFGLMVQVRNVWGLSSTACANDDVHCMQTQVVDSFFAWKKGTRTRIKKDIAYCFVVAAAFINAPYITGATTRILLRSLGAQTGVPGLFKDKEAATFVASVLMSGMCTMLYLWGLTVIPRMVSRDVVPSILFFVLFFGDVFSESIAANFDTGSAYFFALLVIDTMLLIARDADLFEQLGKFISSLFGNRVRKVLLPMIAIMTGQHDVAAVSIVEGGNDSSIDTDAAYQVWRRREMLKQCSQSELLASALLIMIASAELISDRDIVLNAGSTEARKQGVINFLLMLACQLFALGAAHMIVQYKEGREMLSHGRLVAVPAGKKYHCFLTHTKQNKETEEWVVHVKDQLRSDGFEVFFDVDNLREINQSQLDQAIRDSCILFCFLDDKTFTSEWCINEVMSAHAVGVKIRFVVHTDRFHTRELIQLWNKQAPDVMKILLKEQGVEYSTMFREQSMAKLAALLMECEGVVPIDNAFDMAQARHSRQIAQLQAAPTRRRATTISLMLSGVEQEKFGQDALLIVYRIAATIFTFTQACILARDIRQFAS
jgi:hypothetical protein